MKKLILSLAFLSFVSISNLFSQSGVTVNDVPIEQIDVEYILIVETAKVFSNKITIEIDFGQKNKYWSAKDTQVKDENGKLVNFNSMIDALNFMSKNGYEFVDAYSVNIGQQNVYHWMMRKKEN